MSGLEKGQVLEGIVKNITSYGVFIDLGGVDGLIHITDLSWGRVNHPEELVKLDEKIKVVILDFDDNKKRIALGLKQLSEHPWDALNADLKIGDKVKGNVVVIADYGAFIEIAPGVEGLVHVSEMSWSQHLRTANDFLKVGDEVETVVLTLDKEERKMSLGIKQLIPDPWENIATKYPLESKHKAKVRNFTNFGVFVELEEGIDGLIHISDLSWDKKFKHPSEFCNVGEELEVVVLELDVENRRLSLGHKQLQENPWDVYETLFEMNSVHDGTVVKLKDKAGIVSMAYGVEAYCPAKHMKKEDGSYVGADEKAQFKILEFNKEGKKILVSHTKVWGEVEAKRAKSNASRTSKAVRNINDSIFGPISTEELLANAFEKKVDFFGDSITYSPKVFIPLTTMCRDNCGYCTFVKSPKEGGTYLNQEEVLLIAEAGDEAGCYEALFTLGDKPELKWDFALTQLKELGHSSTHDYLISSMKVVNERFNLFPHANPGLMSKQEIKELKKHSPSGGVMIESFSKNIYDKGKAHYKTDTKYIDLRLDTLNNALEEKYPVTTGLLLGLTSTKEEIVNDISNLIDYVKKNSAIQEVILQNFRAKKNTLMKNNSEITNDLFLRIIATTRIYAPSHISLQVPPNLSPDITIFLKSGINDLGGISPLTIDWVNPDHLWPNINKLKSDISNTGQVLKKRLPVYPEFIKKEWLNSKILEKVNNIIDTDGYPKDHYE